VVRGLLVLALAFAFGGTAGAAQSKLIHFKSPSGNINCLGDTVAPVFVDCLVKSSSWAHKPPKPASCDLDWAPTELAVGRRHVSVGACRGDVGPVCGPATGLACTTLAYGHSVDIGPIRCTSAANGVTCRYRTAPRVGFRIAREGYVVFHS
jgi:hypothetical protein